MIFPASRSRPPPTFTFSADVPPPGQRSGEGSGSVLGPLHEDEGRRPQPAPQVPREHPGMEPGERTEGARTVGKFLVSPLIKTMDNGWFASSVSIRSGSGSGTSDRVLRLTRLFRCAKEAAVYAHGEALQWIRAAQGPLAA